MQHKQFQLIETKADADHGTFEATVAVFGNVDKVGDRIVPGAFTKTLERWRRGGDPVPVILSHDWQNPFSHIGVADPHEMHQTGQGLRIKARLDIKDNDVARQVHRLMQRRSLKEFSFGYHVPHGGQRRADDGANELHEIDLVELGPCLKGVNSQTELHAVKAALGAERGDGPQGAEYSLLEITHEEMAGVQDGQLKAVWTGAYINSLPDSSFLYIEPGGDKDSEGKTTPRSLRHFPVKDADGNVDMPHLRNALSRIPQSNLPQSVKDEATARAQRMLNANKADMVDRPKGRSADPLRVLADAVELEFASDGESQRKHKTPKSPERPKPQLSLRELRQKAHDEMLIALSGIEDL
jgi:HK97 family phage prohead protease